MKRLFTILTLLVALSASDAYAQFTVEDETKTKSTGNVTLQNPLHDMDIATDFHHPEFFGVIELVDELV